LQQATLVADIAGKSRDRGAKPKKLTTENKPKMSTNTNSIRRLVASVTLASGLVATGAAASAQTMTTADVSTSTTATVATSSKSSNQPTDAWTQPATWSQLEPLLGGGH